MVVSETNRTRKDRLPLSPVLYDQTKILQDEERGKVSCYVQLRHI